ncbi:MAG: hypothetical protein ACI88H_002812 [Cocleimonas sp.]|jgi:hypothetical protein
MSKNTDKTYNPSPEHPFFYYDPEGDGFVYFKTEALRDKWANDAIQQYLDDCWDEQVLNVVSGTLTGQASMIDVEVKPSATDEQGIDGQGSYWPDDCDYRCDYKIKSLGYSCPSTEQLKD